MSIFENSAFDGHEAVHAFNDRSTGLQGFIAIHSRALGPAFGGCRVWTYGSDEDALEDALRLARGMSYKNALAGLPFGGGKAVILADPKAERTPAYFEAFGSVVDGLGGAYITAEDVGVGVEDMKAVASRTAYVSGIGSKGNGGKSDGGDPSPRTAYGVYRGIREAVSFHLGKASLKGLRVAVQGAGHVGHSLCGYLHEAGASLIVADVNGENAERVVHDFGAERTAPEDILTTEADVLAPCALGAVLTGETIPELKVQVVAGAANNQLADEHDGALLHRRGILFAPDYVINSGGIIAVAAEYQGNFSDALVMERIGRISERLKEIFARARTENRPTNLIADDMAREVIAAAA